MRLLREPLVHFVALGALIFLLYAWLEGPTRSVDTIVVTAATQDNLAAAFDRAWQRPPTAAELDALIAEHVREELAYREAQRMGLDRDDIVVRRRMRQKVELLADEIVAQQPPDDATLQDWYAARSADYRRPAVLSFRQIYFSADADPAAAEAAATGLLVRLRADAGAVDPALAGDPSLLPPVSSNITEEEVAARFGREFADALVALPPGEWHGPVRSGIGLHLVRVDTRFDGRVPALEDVRPAVERDWFVEARRAALDAHYERLRRQYDVIVEPYPAAGAR